jgi:hypothetical protein
MKQKIGTVLKFTVLRNGEEKEIDVKVKPRTVNHQFHVLENPTEQQLKLRNAWMKNF